jgi:hypothetical protein
MIDESKICFVFGAPRSGTSWITSLIAEHPQAVRVTPSLLGYATLDGGFETGVFLRKMHHTAIREAFNLIAGDKLKVEKTIDHAFHVDTIANVFPDARRVLVERDPVDVVWSLMNSDWPPGICPMSYDAAVTYSKPYHNALFLRDDWTLKVSYEGMVQRGVAAVLDVWNLLGLDGEKHWARDVFARCDRAGAYPVGMRDVFRAGRIGDGHRGLNEQQVRFVYDEAGVTGER